MSPERRRTSLRPKVANSTSLPAASLGETAGEPGRVPSSVDFTGRTFQETKTTITCIMEKSREEDAGRKQSLSELTPVEYAQAIADLQNSDRNGHVISVDSFETPNPFRGKVGLMYLERPETQAAYPQEAVEPLLEYLEKPIMVDDLPDKDARTAWIKWLEINNHNAYLAYYRGNALRRNIMSQALTNFQIFEDNLPEKFKTVRKTLIEAISNKYKKGRTNQAKPYDDLPIEEKVRKARQCHRLIELTLQYILSSQK